jgi:hypothetical protein
MVCKLNELAPHSPRRGEGTPRLRVSAQLAADVPVHGFLESFANAVAGLVGKQPLRFSDIRQGVAHVAGTEIAVARVE